MPQTSSRAPDPSEILHMLRHEKTSRVEQQYALARVPTEYLRRAIRPVHSGTDDDRVKRCAAVRGRFVPRVADVAAERIDSKRRILDSNRPPAGMRLGSGIAFS